MIESGLQPTSKNLLDFLDFVAEKGLMKSNTAISYKKASSVILKILDEQEADDLSRLDLDVVFQRHRNLAAGKLPPATLRTYEIRTRAAINTFLDYIKDPSSWKPGIKTRTTKKKSSSSKLEKEKPKKVQTDTANANVLKTTQPTIHIDLQIHISPEATLEQIDQMFASISKHLQSK